MGEQTQKSTHLACASGGKERETQPRPIEEGDGGGEKKGQRRRREREREGGVLGGKEAMEDATS